MNRPLVGIEQGLAIVGLGSMRQQTETSVELLFDSFWRSAPQAYARTVWV